MSTICRVQYLFLSCSTYGLPHFRNTASQILNQMMTECTDSSPTQGTTGSAKLTPNSNCFASQLSCSHASSRNRCSLISLTCLSLYLAWQRLRFWVCPSLQLLVSVWLKRAMSTQGARGKESIHVTTFRVGKILKWTVPLFFLPPSLSPNCQMSLVLQGGERRRGYWSSFTLHTGLLPPLFLFARKYHSHWQQETERGRHVDRGRVRRRGKGRERGVGNKEREEGIMVRK